MTDLRRLLSDMRRVNARLAAAVDHRLRNELGLPLGLFEPMAVIAESQGCRVYDLAARLGVSSGGASKLADRLEAGGYCRRLPNPDDRRSSFLELTPAGRETIARAGLAVDGELEQLLGTVLSTAQIREFAVTLRCLRSAVLRLPPHPASS